MDAGLLTAVKTFLVLPSALFDAIYAMGPVVAPVLGLLLSAAFPFIFLRDKKDA